MGHAAATLTTEDVNTLFDFSAFKSDFIPKEVKKDEPVKTNVFENAFKKEPEEKKPESNRTIEESKPPEPTQTAEQATDTFKQMLSGIKPDMAVNLFDVGVSRLFSMLTKLFGYQGVTYKDYQLDEKEKKTLAPFFEHVLMEWIRKLTPRDALIAIVCFIYFSKVETVVTTKPRKKKVKPNEKGNQNSDNRQNNASENESDGVSSNSDVVRYNKDGSIAKKRGPKGNR